MKKLDDLNINEENIDLLKLYAVGYEKYVLLGSVQTLSKTKCVHFRKYRKKQSEFYNYDYSDVFKILIEHGFKIFQIRKNGKILPIKEYDRVEFHKIFVDFVAIRDVDNFIERTGFKIEEM